MPVLLDTLARVFVLCLGAFIIGVALISAVRTFVVPRSIRDSLTQKIFRTSRKCFNVFLRRLETYEARDRLMAFYAPVTLTLYPVILLWLISIGYALIYWAFGELTFYEAYDLSGSSLLTLGFAKSDGTHYMLLEFSQAAIGMILTALLIGYLPTIYGAFSRREIGVTLLEVRAGAPPSAVTMLERYHRIRGLDALKKEWEAWEAWFADVEESHTSLAALVFFRSPQPGRSWVTAAGTVLDAAALTLSSIDMPFDAQAALCIRGGFIALRRICDFFDIAYDNDPPPDAPISITRGEFEEVFDYLKEQGLPMKPDRDRAWHDYAGWRVNYDLPLLSLATLTMSPYAPWVSDRFLQPRLLSPLVREMSRGLLGVNLSELASPPRSQPEKVA